MSDKVKKICLWSILAVLSAALSMVERPLMAALPLPLPGFKLGIANVCILFCLYRLGRLDAVVVLALRLALTGLLSASPISFVLSVSGGFMALFAACLLYRCKRISTLGVSVASSAMHMTGQISAAVLILETPSLFTSYLPYLLLLSVPTGLLNGFLAGVLVGRIPNKYTDLSKGTKNV